MLQRGWQLVPGMPHPAAQLLVSNEEPGSAARLQGGDAAGPRLDRLLQLPLPLLQVVDLLLHIRLKRGGEGRRVNRPLLLATNGISLPPTSSLSLANSPSPLPF